MRECKKVIYGRCSVIRFIIKWEWEVNWKYEDDRTNCFVPNMEEGWLITIKTS